MSNQLTTKDLLEADPTLPNGSASEVHERAKRYAETLYPKSTQVKEWMGAYTAAKVIFKEASDYVELTDQIEEDLRALISKHTGMLNREEVMEIMIETLNQR